MSTKIRLKLLLETEFNSNFKPQSKSLSKNSKSDSCHNLIHKASLTFEILTRIRFDPNLSWPNLLFKRIAMSRIQEIWSKQKEIQKIWRPNWSLFWDLKAIGKHHLDKWNCFSTPEAIEFQKLESKIFWKISVRMQSKTRRMVMCWNRTIPNSLKKTSRKTQEKSWKMNDDFFNDQQTNSYQVNLSKADLSLTELSILLFSSPSSILWLWSISSDGKSTLKGLFS